jgi:hypothetical protein
MLKQLPKEAENVLLVTMRLLKKVRKALNKQVLQLLLKKLKIMRKNRHQFLAQARAQITEIGGQISSILLYCAKIHHCLTP